MWNTQCDYQGLIQNRLALRQNIFFLKKTFLLLLEFSFSTLSKLNFENFSKKLSSKPTLYGVMGKFSRRLKKTKTKMVLETILIYNISKVPVEYP